MPNLVTLAKSKVYQIFKDSSIVDEGVEHVVLHGFEALLHGAAVEPEAAETNIAYLDQGAL